ncbi:MAG: polyprenyl synthetase family protein [Acidobacteria bacterium]|nr:polyprenyl synthetase family protein [Acidobacteriota bacterium]
MRASSDINPAVELAQGFLAHTRTLVDELLERLVPLAEAEPVSVHSAIRWSLFAGGKRFRPALVLAAGKAFGARAEELLRTACALEMIHTYSLIHDDLPAMDDDNLRRGRPTCHVQFGEATAILAGDALQTLAFQTIAEDERLSHETRVRVIGEVARASGTPAGMVAGQAYDLEAESREVTGAELERIHSHKTGALICASARAGALIAGASAAELDAITLYAEQLGLLFQITDDLLDVTASIEELGKTPGKDAHSSKATYPALYGLEAARELARAAHQKAGQALDELRAEQTQLLRAIAELILHRRG